MALFYLKKQKLFNIGLLFCLLCIFSQESEDKESRRKKFCRCGAGVEETPNMCDTPGFPLRAELTLEHDLWNIDRLESPRIIEGL